MALPKILKLLLSNGTQLDCTGLSAISTTDKGNIEISSAEGKKINIESGDNLAVKPVGNLQHDTSHYAAGEDVSEFCMKAIFEDKDHVQGYNIEAAGVKFITKKADKTRGWDPKKWILKIQESASKYTKAIINASAWDIRTRATAPGTGGGIAIQIASCDSNFKENKFKIETDRIREIENGSCSATEDWNQWYCGEGGKGIEILTINSQFFSAFNKTYRFRGESPLYAVLRDDITTDSDKTDYPTQDDDSKDIIPDEQIADPLTWNKLYQMYVWAKQQGFVTTT